MTPQELVDNIKTSSQFKYKYHGWEDIDIYNDIKSQYPDKEFPEFSTKPRQSESLSDVDISPGFFEWLGTASLAEIGTEGGAFGASEEFWQDAYNKSMSGLIYQAIHGEEKYKDVDYEADWIRQAGQFFVGMISPIELAVFASAGIGGSAGRNVVSKYALKGLRDGVVKKTTSEAGIQTGKHLAHKIATNAVEMGISGSMFSAAHGAVHSAAEQKKKFGSIDAGKVIQDGVMGGLESIPLYAATGGIAGGVFKTLNTFAGLKKYTNTAFGEKVNKLLTGQVPQVGVEAAMFSTLPTVMNMEGAVSFGSDDWWGELGKNALIIGGLRASMRLMKGHEGNVEITKLIDTELKLQGKSLSKELESLKAVKDNIGDLVPKTEILQRIVEKEVQLASIGKDRKLTKSNAEKVIKILDKLDDEIFVKKMQKGDIDVLKETEFILKDGSYLNLVTDGMIKDILRSPEKLEAHFKAQFPDRNPTQTNLNIFKETLKNYSKNLEDYFERLNVAARGDIKAKQGAQPVEDVVVERAVAGRVKSEYVKRTKKQIVNEYNKALDRYITEKFGIDISSKKRDTIKEGFKVDESLKKELIIDDMFSLKDRINQLKTGTQKQVDTIKSKQSIKDLKERVLSIKELESKIGEEPSFWRVGENRQKEIVEIDKTISERKAPTNLNSKQKTIYNDNIVIIRDMLYKKFMQSKREKGVGFLDTKSIKTKIELYNKLNDYASSQNKRIFELNETEIRNFIQGKETLEATALADLIKFHNKRFTELDVRGLTANELQLAVKPAVEPTKGFKVDYLVDQATGKIRDGVDVTTSKYGKEKGVPLTSRLKTALVSIFKRNKSNKTSYRHEQTKVFDPKTEGYKSVYHEFLFTDVLGKAIHKDLGGNILKKLLESETWKKRFGDRKITQKAFRKSFVSFIQERVPKLKDIADAYILGHETGLSGRYFKFSLKEQTALKAQLDKFERIIQGKTEKNKYTEGGKDFLTPHELRELIKGVDTLTDVQGNVKVGHSTISGETIKELIMYQGQSGARVTEALPSNSYLNKIGYNEGYKKWLKEKGISTKKPTDRGEGGGGLKGISSPDFSKQSVKGTKDTLRKGFNSLFKQAGLDGAKNLSKRKDVYKWVYEAVGLGKDYKLGAEVSEVGGVVKFAKNADAIFNKLRELSPSIIKDISSHKTFFRIHNRIIKPDGLKDRMNITDNVQSSILKDLGVIDGKLMSAKIHQIKTYETLLNQLDPNRMSPQNYLQDILSSGLTKMEIKKRLNTFLGIKKAVMPVHVVLESIGMKKLANQLFKHTSAELNYTGKIYDFEYIAKGHLGGGRSGKKKFNKIKDYFYLLDKERYEARLNENTLKYNEKQFINKAIDTKTWKTKNTPEGKVVESYKKMIREYKEATKQALKQIMSKAEYERFKKQGHIKWLSEDKNIYVTRRLTKELRELFDIESSWYKKLEKDQTYHIAQKMARKKHGKTDVSKEQINKFMEEANGLATQEINNLFDFNPGKFSSSYMKTRYTKLPETINIRGKKVQVYETRYADTVNKYAHGMGKFISNVEFFPEYVKLDGLKYKGRTKMLEGLNKIDPKLGEWTDKMVKRHLGIEKSQSDFPVATTALLKWTSILAKLQLSFPTSGLKNLIVGNVQTSLAFQPKRFLQGIFDTMSSDNRRMVESMSAHELGMRHFSPRALSGEGIADKYIFKFGLMKPTERLNRYISVLASMREQKELGRIMRFSDPLSKKYKQAYSKLTDFYKLSDKQISLIKKHGTRPENINSAEFKDRYEAGRVKRDMQVISEQMSTMAHINTQGASIYASMGRNTTRKISIAL